MQIEAGHRFTDADRPKKRGPHGQHITEETNMSACDGQNNGKNKDIKKDIIPTNPKEKGHMVHCDSVPS